MKDLQGKRGMGKRAKEKGVLIYRYIGLCLIIKKILVYLEILLINRGISDYLK